jgi:hypothetical protein
MANLHEQNSSQKPRLEAALLMRLMDDHMLLHSLFDGRYTPEDVANHVFLTTEERNGIYMRLFNMFEETHLILDRLESLMNTGTGFHVNPNMIK